MADTWIQGPSEMTDAAVKLLDWLDYATAEVEQPAMERALRAVITELCLPTPIADDLPSHERLGLKIGQTFAAATLEVLCREIGIEIQEPPAEDA